MSPVSTAIAIRLEAAVVTVHRFLNTRNDSRGMEDRDCAQSEARFNRSGWFTPFGAAGLAVEAKRTTQRFSIRPFPVGNVKISVPLSAANKLKARFCSS